MLCGLVWILKTLNQFDFSFVLILNLANYNEVTTQLFLGCVVVVFINIVVLILIFVAD